MGRLKFKVYLRRHLIEDAEVVIEAANEEEAEAKAVENLPTDGWSVENEEGEVLSVEQVAE